MNLDKAEKKTRNFTLFLFMSTKTTVKRVSVKAVNIRRAASNVVSKSAKDFKTKTRRRMIDSIPSGRVYKRRGGFHRSSARGERPAIDSGKLIANITDSRTAQFAAKVEAETDYAKYLVSEKLDRQIFTDQDISEAQLKFDRDMQIAVDKIIQ